MRFHLLLVLWAATFAFGKTTLAEKERASAVSIRPDSGRPSDIVIPKDLSKQPSPVGKTAIVIPVEEQVDFGLHAFLKRAVAEAEKQNPDYIVFKVNTYGGELQSAFDIVDLLMGISKCSTYVFVEQKAISAGALISLAANRIAMGNGTTIGDCAPITQGQDGIVMLGEKIQSPLRAKFRTLAEKNGYPSLLAEAMVSTEIGVVMAVRPDTAKAKAKAKAEAKPGKEPAIVKEFFTAKQWENMSDKDKAKYTSHKVVVALGQLATFTDREAAEYGFSQGSFTSLEAFLDSKGWTKIQEVATTWSEDLVRAIGTVAPLLMMLGFGALYMEFKTPGLSIFGLIGALCLSIVFGSKYAVGLANHTELLLLLAGFALVMAEVYVFPGTFIAGAMGLAFILIALTLSLQSFTLPDPSMPWELRSLVDNLFTTIGSAVVALLIPLFIIRFVLPRLPAGGGVIPSTTLADARSVVPETIRLPVGTIGKTKTPLRPTGKALFGGETVEVISGGDFLEVDQTVEVYRIDGNKILVRPKGVTA
ncbi:MAG: ATP-dependent Clp protease proteolytic subunit [Fibrobacterota bacterium]|nr:ATP-dependent Clp protease proteolytic subunit [Fibrobacterota bacterium]